MITFSKKDCNFLSIVGEELSLIREHFSCANPTYAKNKFNKFAPSRIYCITPSGRADIGLLSILQKYCIEQNIQYSTDSALMRDVGLNETIYNLPLKPGMSLRDYQSASVIEALRKGRGIIVLPTAAGKTLTIATLVESLRYNNNIKQCLIIVPSIQLVEQTYEDFLKYGISSEMLSKWSGSNTPDLNKPILIASLQILQSDKQDLSILDSIETVIVDECHKVRRGNQINDILKKIKTNFKFGFTGTLPPDKIDQWNLIGKIGPILYEKKSIELRNVQQIAGVEIQILEIDYLTKPSLSAPSSTNPTKAYDEENEFLNQSSERNRIISNISKKTDKNTLVLVERITHGEALTKLIKENCPEKDVYFIQGSIDVSDRENIRQLMEINNNIICVAISKIFSTGISINNLHYIVFASAGKAKIKILQSIGRGLRLHPLKNKVYIFDIADNLRYGRKHLTDRIKLYEEEKIQYKRHRLQC